MEEERREEGETEAERRKGGSKIKALLITCPSTKIYTVHLQKQKVT